MSWSPRAKPSPSPLWREESGLAKATLYRRPELRAIVEQHRRDDREAHSLTGIVTELGLLRQGLETVAAKVRQHEEQLRQMRRKL